MKQRRLFSARMKVAIATFVILLAQVFIFYIVFSKIDVFDMLENSTYRYYTRRLEQSALKLEDKLVHTVTSSETGEQLVQTLKKDYRDARQKKESLVIDEKIAADLMKTLTGTGASGALIYLSEDLTEGGDREEIFYVRDNNPQLKLRDNSDLMLEMGDANFSKKFNLTMSNSWKPSMRAGAERSENLDKIKEKLINTFHGTRIRDSKKLAFWVGAIDLTDRGEKTLIYVEPLIEDRSGELFGFIVFELNNQALSDIIDIDAMPSEFTSSFAIIQKNPENEVVHGGAEKVTLIDYFGDRIEDFEGKEEIVYRKVDNKYHSISSDSIDMYFLVRNGISEPKTDGSNIYGLPKELRIYDRDSLHTERFFLVLFLAESNFYYNQNAYSKGVMLSVFISILFAVLFSMFSSYHITRPVKELALEIENADISKKIVLKKSNIKEIDLLVDKIEKLSYDIGNFYFKVQNLFEALGRAIVILEEDVNTKNIYRTGRISAMLGDPDENESFVEELSRFNFENSIRQYIDGKSIEKIRVEGVENFTVIAISNGEKKIYLKYDKKVHEDRLYHIYMDYTEEYNNIIKFENEKNYDFLTLLPNRKYFKELVTQCMQQYPDEKYAMIMWDLDNLKYINDIYGHDWGDSYLKQTAEVISTLEAEKVFLSRFSGDEFFAFVRYGGDKDELRAKLNRLQNKLLETKVEISDYDSISIRASVGLSWYPEDGSKYEDLYKYADFAMYQAKHTNKGTIVEFDRERYDKDYIILLGKEDLNRLIEQRLVRFAFQPIVSVETGEIFGYEALMRSRSENIDSVDKIMKMAKLQYKLPELENLTFDGVFDALRENEIFIKDRRIFINSIASVSLPERSEKMVKEKFAKYSDQIVVEITESEEVSNDALDKKKTYRSKFGIQIAIDDFGSGYSTETSLLEINPDFIKIDMMIIRDVHKDKNRYQLVKSICDYSKIRGIKIIAEGVEVEEELQTMIELGADYIQGYYLAKPSFEIADHIPEEKKEKILSFSKNLRRF